ncbi:MAG: lipid II flippase MurJ, partial [Actinomycetota bacterium]
MRSLVRSTAMMTVGTVLSRATGLMRVAAIAYAFGVVESGRLTDTYNLANTAPNIIYELLLGGVVTSVFIPVFVELLEKEGRTRAWEVASAIINVALVALTVLTGILIVAAPALAKLYTLFVEGAQAELQQQALTTLLRLLIPQIIFYGLFFITAGLLNAHKRFGAPMYTPILNNLVVIATFVTFRRLFGSVDLTSITPGQLWFLGLGTTAGVVANALGLLPFARGLGRYRWTLAIGHPSIRKLGRLSVFVIG